MFVLLCWESLDLICTTISWYTEWQGNKCMLQSPKMPMKHKMFSLQLSYPSVPMVVGRSLPTLALGFKYSPLSRSVCIGPWSWNFWWPSEPFDISCILALCFQWEAHVFGRVIFLLWFKCRKLGCQLLVFFLWGSIGNLQPVSLS